MSTEWGWLASGIKVTVIGIGKAPKLHKSLHLTKVKYKRTNEETNDASVKITSALNTRTGHMDRAGFNPFLLTGIACFFCMFIVSKHKACRRFYCLTTRLQAQLQLRSGVNAPN
jgi:hypothetical protein